MASTRSRSNSPKTSAPGTGSLADPPRPRDLLLLEVAHHCAGRAGAIEGVEDEADGALHLRPRPRSALHPRRAPGERDRTGGRRHRRLHRPRLRRVLDPRLRIRPRASGNYRASNWRAAHTQQDLPGQRTPGQEHEERHRRKMETAENRDSRDRRPGQVGRGAAACTNWLCAFADKDHPVSEPPPGGPGGTGRAKDARPKPALGAGRPRKGRRTTLRDFTSFTRGGGSHMQGRSAAEPAAWRTLVPQRCGRAMQ